MRDKYQEFGDIQYGNKENSESFVLPGCDAEFEKNKEGLEEPRSNVRSGVKSDVSSDVGSEMSSGELKSLEDIAGVTCADREEIMYDPIQTALSQNEFQSTTESRRPACHVGKASGCNYRRLVRRTSMMTVQECHHLKFRRVLPRNLRKCQEILLSA